MSPWAPLSVVSLKVTVNVNSFVVLAPAPETVLLTVRFPGSVTVFLEFTNFATSILASSAATVWEICAFWSFSPTRWT